MAETANHRVPFRRRQEQQTDYAARLELLKAGVPRAVIRLSNSHARVQFVAYGRDGDQTAAAATSGDLAGHGWTFHTGNLPAAYLTGYLAATRAQAAGITDAVADLGVRQREAGGRYYAAVMGVRDAGVDVPVDDAVLPAERRVQGGHAAEHDSAGIVDAFKKVRDSIDEVDE